MEVRLNNKDRFRVYADFEDQNFIDIAQTGYEAMTIEMYAFFQIIEVRKKESFVNLFLFRTKEERADYDFGYWLDAEILLTIDETKNTLKAKE